MRTRLAVGVLGAAALAAVAVAFALRSGGSEGPPDSPEGTVRFVGDGLAAHRPEVAWQALPPSWQGEITDLVHESAEAADPDLWTAGTAVFTKLTRVLVDKKDLILAHPLLAAQVKDKDEAAAILGGLGRILEELAGSELADRDAMRRLDPERFLAGTGSRLLARVEEMVRTVDTGAAEALGALGQLEVTAISREADAARLRICAPGKPAAESDWARVEGRWIPKPIADAWPEAIAAARQAVRDRAAMDASARQATLVQLRVLSGVLDLVLATKTAEEFHAASTVALGTPAGAAFAEFLHGLPFPASPSAPAATPSWPEPPPIPLPGANQATAAPAPITPANPAAAAEYEMSRTVSLGEVHLHLGRPLHVVTRGGSEFDGKLLAAGDRLLTFEREWMGGSTTYDVERDDVKSLTAPR